MRGLQFQLTFVGFCCLETEVAPGVVLCGHATHVATTRDPSKEKNIIYTIIFINH